MLRTPVLEPRIFLGKAQVDGKQYWIPLEWKENNGILIAGQSGSGKSQTAAFYLNQYAYQGTKLIICDFDSPDQEEDTLSERISHLAGAFYLPVAKKPTEIQDRLRVLNLEYQRRRDDHTRRFPLMLVIDEVSAFLSYIKEDEGNAIDNFARDLLLMRKVGIRAMIIGQEWSSGFSTQIMRPIRSAFRVKVIHKLDSANAKMVLDFPSSQKLREIGNLPTGVVYVDDRRLLVPMLDHTEMKKAEKRVMEYAAQDIASGKLIEKDEVAKAWNDSWWNGMIKTYGKSAGYAEGGFDPEDTKELVRFWYKRGHSKHAIINYLVKGKATTISKLYEEMLEETGNTTVDSA